jgi:hypothetical protein
MELPATAAACAGVAGPDRNFLVDFTSIVADMQVPAPKSPDDELNLVVQRAYTFGHPEVSDHVLVPVRTSKSLVCANIAAIKAILEHSAAVGTAETPLELAGTGYPQLLIALDRARHNAENPDQATQRHYDLVLLQKMTPEQIVGCIEPANYLDYRSFHRLLCEELAARIKHYTSNEMRYLFNYPDDLTPERKQEIREAAEAAEAARAASDH